MITKEQIAHDLAIAVITAKLTKKTFPQSSKELLTAYQDEFQKFLHFQEL